MPDFDSAVSQKNFFKGDKVQMKWNREGTSLIVLAQTEVDKSGKTYLGETTLYLLSANGGFDSRVDLGMLILRIWMSHAMFNPADFNRQGRANI